MHWFSYDGQYFFNLWNKDRVGRHENLFILFLMAIKITGSAQKYRVGRLAETQVFFFFGLMRDTLESSKITWEQLNIFYAFKSSCSWKVNIWINCGVYCSVWYRLITVMLTVVFSWPAISSLSVKLTEHGTKTLLWHDMFTYLT